MICDHCLARIAQRPSYFSSTTRAIRRTFASAAVTRATPVTADHSEIVGRPNDKPAATTTSAAQPFTAGTTSNAAIKEKKEEPRRPKSSVPAGMVLKHINFVKGKPDPIAMEDHEYPDWLWSALDKKAKDDDDAAGEGDLFSKSKKQRRVAAKALRKRQLANPESMLPKVPLQEQTIDLYAGDGTVEGAKQAGADRQELTKALRDQRRSKIKEANFLKAMG